MKRFSTLIISCLLSHGAMADTDLNIHGSLIADPCKIDTSSEEQVIDFSSIAAKTFINSERTLPEPFSIELKECDLSVSNVVSIMFNGDQDDDVKNGFSVKGKAEGIAIVIEDSNGQVIVPGASGTPQDLTSENSTLRYNAYVQSKNFAAIEEGDFEAVVTFSVSYE